MRSGGPLMEHAPRILSMTTDHGWRHDWVLDPGPLVEAQARHVPSGIGFTVLATPPFEDGWEEGRYLAVVHSEDGRPLIDALMRQRGQQSTHAWLSEMGERARQLWREAPIRFISEAKT